MRAPDFWWHERPNIAARLLQPVGTIYGAVTAARMSKPGRRLAVPVICIGNLTAGGAGKTPMAIALGRHLEAAGHQPAFLTRGYGRRNPRAQSPLRVDLERHKAEDCGDEPLLLARIAPTYVAADRGRAAEVAIADGASILLLDDGLQNPSIAKNLTVAVADAAVGFGNGLCVPAGPLRALPERQWPHVGLFCVIGAGAAEPRIAALASEAGIAVTHAHLVPDQASLDRLEGRPLMAFAGIGRPDKFFETLGSHGLDVVGRVAFPDHHAFMPEELSALRRQADALGARLVTTAKDRMRLPATFACETLPVDLVFDNPEDVMSALDQALRR